MAPCDPILWILCCTTAKPKSKKEPKVTLALESGPQAAVKAFLGSQMSEGRIKFAIAALGLDRALLAFWGTWFLRRDHIPTRWLGFQIKSKWKLIQIPRNSLLVNCLAFMLGTRTQTDHFCYHPLKEFAQHCVQMIGLGTQVICQCQQIVCRMEWSQGTCHRRDQRFIHWNMTALR